MMFPKTYPIFVIGLIMAILLFCQIPALADPGFQPVSAQLTGYVSDLGNQRILFGGNGGEASLIPNVPEVNTNKLNLWGDVQVVDSSVNGNGGLRFEGTTSDGIAVKVAVDFQISSGEGLKLPCDALPAGLPCDRRDLIPLVYLGAGTASIEIGSAKSQLGVIVVGDASNHPKLLGGIYRVMGLDLNNQPVLDFTVNLSYYTVYYKDSIVIAKVYGDLVGDAITTVNSYENHMASPSETCSTDSGKIHFRVIYNGQSVEMSGFFRGSSTGWPLYPYVNSSGTFKTIDDATLLGTYTTTWDTPFTFTTQFVGNIHVIN